MNTNNLDAVVEIVSLYGSKCWDSGRYNQDIDDPKEIAKQILAVVDDGWVKINSKDDLPEPDELYLVLMGADEADLEEGNGPYVAICYLFPDSTWDVHCTETVTHWREKPALPTDKL